MTITRNDCVTAALDVYLERGLTEVDLGPVGERLGASQDAVRTHFTSRDDLVRAALDHWRTHFTEESIDLMRGVDEPVERLAFLLSQALTEWFGAPADRAVLADAGSPLVTSNVRKVHDIRIGFIAEQYEELGLPRDRARARAVLAYAASLGLLALRPIYGESLGFDLDVATDVLTRVP